MTDNKLAILDSIYAQSLSGIPGSESLKELAESYMLGAGSIESKADSLIRYQIAKCGTTGFLTGLGGMITLPIAIPADVGVNLYVQMRMAAAIAYMGGYDLKSDQVKTFVYVALCGNAAQNVLKDVGINIAGKITKNLI